MESGQEQQDIKDMDDGHHSDSDTYTHGSEYMTDIGNDSDKELHCTAHKCFQKIATRYHGCQQQMHGCGGNHI